MKIVTWTTSTGSEIEITLETVYGLNLQGRRETSGTKEVLISGKVDGQNHSSCGGLQTVTGHPTCVCRLGKIGITQEQLNQINEVKSQLELEISDHNKQLDDHSQQLDKLGNGDINKTFGCNC